MFIFCRVTENEPKEHVQKPTVSKDFPYAQNAPWERRFERSHVKAHHTLGVYPTVRLIVFDGAPWVLLRPIWRTAKCKLYGEVYPKTVVF